MWASCEHPAGVEVEAEGNVVVGGKAVETVEVMAVLAVVERLVEAWGALVTWVGMAAERVDGVVAVAREGS